MGLRISQAVEQKLLEKHGVTIQEVIECFQNRDAGFLEDSREEHKTEPATLWFIAETDRGRNLKVCFVYYADTADTVIKTAYPPNRIEIGIYERLA